MSSVPLEHRDDDDDADLILAVNTSPHRQCAHPSCDDDVDPGAARRCGGCEAVFYCSVAHQTECWSDHRRACQATTRVHAAAKIESVARALDRARVDVYASNISRAMGVTVLPFARARTIASAMLDADGALADGALAEWFPTVRRSDSAGIVSRVCASFGATSDYLTNAPAPKIGGGPIRIEGKLLVELSYRRDETETVQRVARQLKSGWQSTMIRDEGRVFVLLNDQRSLREDGAATVVVQPDEGFGCRVRVGLQPGMRFVTQADLDRMRRRVGASCT